MEYKYYMNERPPMPGAVPKNFIRFDEEDEGGRYGAIFYDHELTAEEVNEYELNPAGVTSLEEPRLISKGMIVDTPSGYPNGKPHNQWLIASATFQLDRETFNKSLGIGRLDWEESFDEEKVKAAEEEKQKFMDDIAKRLAILAGYSDEEGWQGKAIAQVTAEFFTIVRMKNILKKEYR